MARSKNFEQALKDLESIVKELETGELPLDKALKRFEEGMRLSQQCSQILDETEGRINQLIKDSTGQYAEQAFDRQESDSNG
jgi:exodeoxyribonuclease VII small subunit